MVQNPANHKRCFVAEFIYSFVFCSETCNFANNVVHSATLFHLKFITNFIRSTFHYHKSIKVFCFRIAHRKLLSSKLE